MRKLGINLHAMPGLSDEAYVKTMAGLGFSATFTGPRNYVENAELFAANGIAYESVHAPFKGINAIWLAGEDGDAMYKELADCVDGCAAASVPIMVVHLSSGQTPPSITDIGRARFANLVEYAAKKNVLIAFENQRMLGNLAWALETFGPDVAGFCWDCGHESCFTPGREYMPLFGDRLEFLHIHDNYGVFNEDKHLLPFDGGIDFHRFAEHIRRSGFTGTLMLEAIAKNSNAYDLLTPEEYLAKAAIAAKRLATLVNGE